MSKVRVIVAEIEGSDEAVLSAIRAVTERMGLGIGVGDGGVQPVAALPAAPAESAVKRIAPARKTPDVRKERAEAVSRIAPVRKTPDVRKERAEAVSRIAPARKTPDVRKERAEAVSRIAYSNGTLSAQIRAAVADGPKTNDKVLEYVRAHGYPDADSSTVSAILCQRRKANEMYKDDADLKRHMAAR